MGLPTTLAGIVGFMICLVLLVSMSASDLFPDQTKGIQNTNIKFNTYLNATTNQSVSQSTDAWGAITNVFNFITGVFGMIITFLAMIIEYLAFFLGIGILLPPEFYVFFAIVAGNLIVAIILLLFLNGK